MTDSVSLCSEMIAVILGKHFYGHYVFLSCFIQQNFFIYFWFVSFVWKYKTDHRITKASEGFIITGFQKESITEATGSVLYF